MSEPERAGAGSVRRLAIGTALVAIGFAGLFLDSAAHLAVTGLGLPSWVDRLYLVPLAVAAALYAVTGPGGSWRLPEREFTTRSRVVMIVIWLGAAAATCGMVVLVNGRGAILDGIALMTTHLIAQELYFRGALIQVGMRLWPAAPSDRDPIYGPALLVASLVFAAAQLQYSGFELAKPVIYQALRAFFLGFLMAFSRVYFRSLWPSATFHAINNFLVGYRG
jgi:membrane protease YdiL (CAAX protease family)